MAAVTQHKGKERLSDPRIDRPSESTLPCTSSAVSSSQACQLLLQTMPARDTPTTTSTPGEYFLQDPPATTAAAERKHFQYSPWTWYVYLRCSRSGKLLQWRLHVHVKECGADYTVSGLRMLKTSSVIVLQVTSKYIFCFF